MDVKSHDVGVLFGLDEDGRRIVERKEMMFVESKCRMIYSCFYRTWKKKIPLLQMLSLSFFVFSLRKRDSNDVAPLWLFQIG